MVLLRAIDLKHREWICWVIELKRGRGKRIHHWLIRFSTKPLPKGGRNVFSTQRGEKSNISCSSGNPLIVFSTLLFILSLALPPIANAGLYFRHTRPPLSLPPNFLIKLLGHCLSPPLENRRLPYPPSFLALFSLPTVVLAGLHSRRPSPSLTSSTPVTVGLPAPRCHIDYKV